MFLSIIIPVYNREHLICRALQSVIDQTTQDYEIIVVDDGSTDNTAAVVRDFGPRVTLLSQRNQGPGAARNYGARVATGEYIAFLDSDDYWYPWAMETIREAIKLTNHPPILQTSFLYETMGNEPSAQPRAPLQYLLFNDVYEYALKKPIKGAGATILKREAFYAVGGFSPGRIVGEDIDLMFKLGTSGKMALVTHPAIFAYRRHLNMTTLSVDAWYRGAMHMIRQELNGIYPGGDERRKERRTALAEGASYQSLMCLKGGGIRYCLRIYLATVTWQILSGRFEYLVKTPFRLLLTIFGLWPDSAALKRNLNER